MSNKFKKLALCLIASLGLAASADAQYRGVSVRIGGGGYGNQYPYGYQNGNTYGNAYRFGYGTYGQPAYYNNSGFGNRSSLYGYYPNTSYYSTPRYFSTPSYYSTPRYYSTRGYYSAPLRRYGQRYSSGYFR
ncbi:MAG: hypothetical protein MUC43_10150 [Pirellula sp.]|nr:hypothetical protein [Pirellula sp.]